MNSGQYPVQMTRKPMQERGLKGVKNPKTPLGEPATGPSRSLRLRRSFKKSVSIYPRPAPAWKSTFLQGSKSPVLKLIRMRRPADNLTAIDCASKLHTERGSNL